MFDSPLHFCPLCKDFVALDEGLDECMRLHGCPKGACPIAHLMVEPMPVAIVDEPQRAQATVLVVTHRN